MCLALYKPANVSIPFEHLVAGQKANSDGCGMAWVEDGAIHTFKSMEFGPWCDKYYDVLDRCGEIDMLIHFRITSRGATTVDMCHPFMINDNMCIIHNGTITNIKASEMKDGDSDTKVLAEQILANLPVGWEYNIAIQRLLEDYVGWSKLVVMTNESHVYIFNEDSGYWDKGVWYSNKSYVTYKKYNTTTTTTTGREVSTFVHGAQSDNYYGMQGEASSEWCDGCFKEFTYTSLSVHGIQLLCAKCLARQVREDHIKAIGQAFTGVTLRPCSSCRSLTNIEELYHLEIEFNEDIDEHPKQLDMLQRDLIKPHPTYGNVGTGYSCQECYELLMTCYEDVIFAVSILDFPSKLSEQEVTELECATNN
jgi:glutamine amidotransferase